jgi:hypothetical protein
LGIKPEYSVNYFLQLKDKKKKWNNTGRPRLFMLRQAHTASPVP